MTKEAFDGLAEGYDSIFTESSIGKAQRAVVHSYLAGLCPPTHPLKILELNGGTGEDACMLASLGHKVHHTEVSDQMIRITKEKVNQRNLASLVTSQKLNLKNLPDWSAGQYDVIFSNFGGLNCLSREELMQLSDWLARQLKPNGQFIAVIMPKKCLWEIKYFSAKLQFRKAFRRWGKRPVVAQLEDGETNVWYYDPKVFGALFSKAFQAKEVIPVAVAVPPSYLQPWIDRHPRKLEKYIRRDEKRLTKPGWAAWGDHYLMAFSKKGS